MFMLVQTDWDFGIRFNGHDYTAYEFTIEFDTVEDLTRMEILGPFGSGKPTYTSEWEQAVARVRDNPAESFDTTGGNRGVFYCPGTTVVQTLVIALRDLLAHEGQTEVNGIGMESDSTGLEAAKEKAYAAIELAEMSQREGTR